MGAVLRYFEAASERYDFRSRSGLWKSQRRREERAMLSLMTSLRPESILELGCGSGYYSAHLRQMASNLTCVDFSAGMLKQIQIEPLRKVCASMEEFSSGGPFDLIFCAGALEFSADPRRVMNNAESMLAPEGDLILLVPSNNLLAQLYRLFHWSHGVPVNLFSRERIQRDLCGSNFRLERRTRVFPFSLCLHLRRNS